jgi:hypothetical protein
VPALINTLLSQRDSVEIIRDQLAAILKLELARQAELGLDPEPRVFLERSNPWGVLLEEPPDESPIVNVQY